MWFCTLSLDSDWLPDSDLDSDWLSAEFLGSVWLFVVTVLDSLVLLTTTMAVYTSWLQRAIETAWYCMDELDCLWLPMIKR